MREVNTTSSERILFNNLAQGNTNDVDVYYYMCLLDTGNRKLRKEREIKDNLGFMNGVPNNYMKIEVEMKVYRDRESGIV